jgi:hypothetical protein
MRHNHDLKLNDKVFSMASNLFGFGSTETRIDVEKNIAIEKAIDDTSSFKIKAVYPAIIGEAFSQTMDNYRIHINQYNFRVSEENAQIEKHNQSVKRFRAENTISEVQKTFSDLFIQNKAKYNTIEYNEKVETFCAEYGLLVAKKKIATVKYTTELVFQNLLHLYNAQLSKRNEQYIKLGVATPRALQEFKINSFLVTQLKRNEINSIAICPKTVRSHRIRLQEAGIFVEYHFAGRNRAVEVHINPEILVVFDLKTAKLVLTENQSLKVKKETILPDNNENTRTPLNESKKNENVENISLFQRSSLSLTPLDLFFTGTPTSKTPTSTGGAGEKAPQSLSQKLLECIIHPQDLAVSLASGEFNHYTPIDIRLLYKEAYSGTLTREEFRELAIQDFFKTTAKIWKHSTPYAGSWKKAISLYYQNKWIAFTADAFNKSVLVEDIQQMRWRIEWARKWFFKNDFNPLFPYDYFDMTRKTSKEVGFEYTKAKWNEHLLATNKYDQLKKKQEANAKRRHETINYAKKCENEVARFLKHKITMPQLFDYVEKNLPAAFLEKLPDIIESKVLKQNEKTLHDSDFAKFNLNDF